MLWTLMLGLGIASFALSWAVLVVVERFGGDAL
jgi:hypothetical protein